jgi:hypothetical protein
LIGMTLYGGEAMPENPHWPVVGLPLSEWQAALVAIERVLPRIDNRLMRISLRKDGCLVVETGALMGGLQGGGHELLLRKGEHGWTVEEIDEWAS